MSLVIALLGLLLLAAHLATSAWRHGTGYFLSAQACAWTACAGTAAHLRAPTATLLLLLGTALFSLLLNIKYLTATTCTDLRYLHPAHFRRFCRETGESGLLAVLTLSGLYILLATAWALAIYKFVRVHL